MIFTKQFIFFFVSTFISLISIQLISAQPAQNEIITNALEKIENARTEGISEINESMGNASKSITKVKENAIESPYKENTVKKLSEEIAMKVQFEEHDNDIFAESGWLQVSDFAFVTSNSSKLCPVSACEYDLEDGLSIEGSSTGDRTFTGKFKVDTGESKKVMNMRGSWETVEERETPDGETILTIEGDLGMGRNQFSPENKYQINGTLTSDGEDYILELKGINPNPKTKIIENSDEIKTDKNCMTLHDGSDFCP